MGYTGIRLADIKEGVEFIEKTPESGWDKCMKIAVTSVRDTWVYDKNGKRRNTKSIYYLVCDGQYYPARNSTEKHPIFLDGMIGGSLLSSFKKRFKLFTDEKTNSASN